jgi:hypothetical protein
MINLRPIAPKLMFEQMVGGGEVCRNSLQGEYRITTDRKLNACNIHPPAVVRTGSNLRAGNQMYCSV